MEETSYMGLFYIIGHFNIFRHLKKKKKIKIVFFKNKIFPKLHKSFGNTLLFFLPEAGDVIQFCTS